MRVKPILAATTLGLALAAGPAGADGVRTLSSDEMVETFIQDSAIVVSPRSNRQARTVEESKALAIRALVMPGEPIRTESQEQQSVLDGQSSRLDGLSEAQRFAEEEFIRRSLRNDASQVANITPSIDAAIPSPALFGTGAVDVPNPPFTRSFFNDQLGLASDGQTLDFSIGNNLPGVDNINVPQSINEGPVRLEPRAGGGFDLSIDIPQN